MECVLMIEGFFAISYKKYSTYVIHGGHLEKKRPPSLKLFMAKNESPYNKACNQHICQITEACPSSHYDCNKTLEFKVVWWSSRKYGGHFKFSM